MAMLLHGREIGKEITKEEALAAKEAGLVVVFGYSDDNAELEGAIYDEVGCYDGGTIHLNRSGVCKKKDRTAKIKALWCPKDEAGQTYASWAYQTDLPHHTFDIMEEGELYCRGIVFQLSDIPS